MPHRNSAERANSEATRLIGSPKFHNSRTLRRFLSEFITADGMCQCFAFDEGYSPGQLEALHGYAVGKASGQQAAARELGFEFVGTIFDKGLNLVQNAYKVPFKLEEATLKQMQDGVRMVQVLSFGMLNFSHDPAAEVGFEDYAYRNLPCSIAADEALWKVSGTDKRDSSSGVLEWCYDETDAKAVLDKMKRFPYRFAGLRASPYLSGSGANSALA